jgi:ubiquinone/menaquinone biosynthesis C-methylase UbiE
MRPASHIKEQPNGLHEGNGQLIPSQKLELQALGEDLMAVIRHLPLRPDSRVLEVGCGSGALSLAIAKYLGADGMVMGVDLAEEHVAFARRNALKAGLQNLSFSIGDVTGEIAGLSGDFDVVICRYVLMYMLPESHALQFLGHMKRWAGERGTVVCIEPDVNFRAYRYPESTESLGSALDETIRWYYEREIMDWRCGIKLFNYLRLAGFQDVDVKLIDGRVICGGKPAELVAHDNMDLELLLAPVLDVIGRSGDPDTVVGEWRAYSESGEHFLYTPIFMGTGRQ